MTTRTYKTADEALEAANRHIVEINRTLDSYWGMLMDGVDTQPRTPVQFDIVRVEKPEPTAEPVIDLSQLVAGDKVRLRCGEICIVSQFKKHELEYPLIVDFRGYSLRFDRSGKARPAGVLAIKLSINTLDRMTEADFQIVEIVRPRGKMEQVSITNWPETLKPDWEGVGVDRDGSVKPVDKLSYMQPANPDPWKDAEELRRKLEMELESHRRLKRQILGLDPYPPKITTPKPVHPLLDFPSVYASVQIEG